jgi:PAS domain S-box-containing protein
VETSPDIIWEMDLQGTIRYVSPQIRTIMGFSPEEIIGRSVTEMVPEQIKSQIIRELADYGSLNGSLAPFAVPARHRDGRTLVIEIRPSVTDTNGKRAGFRGLAVDITERKRAEEALHRANRQLGLLTGITRHDILNKVSVILGYLRIAEKKNTDPAIGDYLRKVDAATTAIRSQIEFTRVYQDLGTHEPQWLWLDEVMPRLYLPPAVALKADGQGIQVFADPMLERVFFNLLDNSIRHGQRVSEIRVMPLRAGEDLVVVWEDNGIGIPAGEKERIFERGFGRNSGLGMFMVREILSLTGITIRETGVPGTGSRFEIVVPNGAFRITEDDKTGTTIRKNPVLKPSTAGQSGAPPGTSSTTGQ